MSFKVREAVVRYKKERDVIETIRNPEEVWKFFIKKVKGETKEVFYCLYLSQSNGALCFEQVSIGTSTAGLIDLKGVMRTALLVGAESLILVHNHPSGNCEPSQEDKEMTKKFIEACKILNLEVLDHVIVGDEAFTSMKGRGDL